MNPKEILKKYWGYDVFRPLQEEIIQSILEGNDTLALLPTGGGKSICFQVPGLVIDGLTLVISPLIALMRDQVQNLEKKGIKAAAITSGMSIREIDITLDNACYDHYKFLYVSPERLQSEIFQERIHKLNISCIAVDEAHCISQWGYDFRPAYLQVADIRKQLPNVPIIALTATATERVKEDIQEKLLFKEKNVFQKSFERSNLAYVVLYEEDKRKKLLDILQKVPGSALVYVRNRKKTKEIAEVLKKNNIPADYYHAGLGMELREQKQQAWIKGEIRVMACTNAFGMGIDKPDVRTVTHMGLPGSVEDYYQEAGRAGRDGKKAYATLLYNDHDAFEVEEWLKLNVPTVSDLKRIYEALGGYFQLAVGGGKDQSFDFDIHNFCKRYDQKPLYVFNVLKTLEQQELIALSESFYQPSKVMITASKEDIYRFEIENKSYEPIIKNLLRGYGGLFDHLTTINEKQLAQKTGITESKVIGQIQYLEKNNLLIYEKRKDQSQITFIKERLSIKDIKLNVAYIKERQQIQVQNLKAMLQYAQVKNVCRSQQLLQYFGEESAPCGHCDVCLGRNDKRLSNATQEQLSQKIKSVLNKVSLSTNELINEIGTNQKEKILHTLQWLKDTNQVKETSLNQLTWID